MALNPKMILASDLQSYFVDKTTGEPLSGGKITFYSDDSQSSLKPVYQLTGTAAPYNYSELENPITLSSVGTIQDELGNDIVVYYYPFEDDPEDDSDTQELYYITVDDSAGTRQFVRHAWPYPDGAAESQTSNDQINFIPNGQFLAHLDGDAQLSETIGSLTVKNIAWGGWTQEDQTGIGGTYTSEFTAINAGAPGLSDFPPYFLDYSCTGASIGTHQIGIKWRDVNMFEFDDDPIYTFSLYCESNNATTYTFDVILVKYFGTSGSATTESTMGTVQFAPGGAYRNVTVNFGDNSLKTVGAGSYVQLVLRPQSPTTFDVRLTDVVLAFGNVTIDSYPVMTNAQSLSQSVAGWMATPAADGSDLYLPLVLTASGMVFDDSEIGNIVAKSSNSVVNGNELLCDGTNYLSSGYSSIGIPYSRLFDKLFNNGNSYNIPLYGTGTTFATAYINSGLTSQIVLCTNTAGSQTVTANGASSPAFTISSIAGGATIFYNGWANAGGIITGFLSTSSGTNGGASVGAGTSGMTVADYNNPALTGYNYAFQITSATAAALGNGAGAGKYFTFSNASTNYYVWFRTATETDPAPGGTGIQCTLDLNMTAADTANVIANVISRYQVSYITVGSAATITSGNYFTFYANSTAYNVWYSKDGTGSAPVGNNIEVDISTGDTAAQVASKTQIAINSYYFAVPDLRGAFLRGYDAAARWNLDYASRFGINNNAVSAGTVGSWELSQFEKHNHANTAVLPYTAFNAAGGASAVLGDGVVTSKAVTMTNASTGGTESRPINLSVAYFIKY